MVAVIEPMDQAVEPPSSRFFPSNATALPAAPFDCSGESCGAAAHDHHIEDVLPRSQHRRP
jgi:hypothetical protein